MRTSDFDYQLPPDLIAQHPAEPRDASRLLVLHRDSGQIEHRHFRDLPDCLAPPDVLVVNESKVIPARLLAKKLSTGGKVELLLLRRMSSDTWETLVGGKRVLAGQQLQVGPHTAATVVEHLGGTRRAVRFEQPVEELMEAFGQAPLPPYIKEPLRDPRQYQTVFARHPGSAAAPTAGLHFTPELLDRIERAGVTIVRLTLHIGLDTFAPVTEAAPEQHTIHREWCRLDDAAAQRINQARREGGRIVAVGTTTVRTLETAVALAPPRCVVAPYQGATELFILPGFRFRAVDALVTNFHLPRSTLLMMVSAFAGRERILQAYEAAKALRYRFYSFGDAMLIS